MQYFVKEGQRVSQGLAVVEVAELNILNFEGSVGEAEVELVGNGMDVELSLDAIDQAEPNIKDNIKDRPFNPIDFESNSFDIIFSAMVIEHFVDVNGLLNGIHKLLKPGGVVILITHDERHILSKLLKNKHPIINDEHVAVFSIKTLEKILLKHNFDIIENNSLKNTYSINYWLKMAPMPRIIKSLTTKLFRLLKIIDVNVGIKAGNIYCLAQKPNL